MVPFLSKSSLLNLFISISCASLADSNSANWLSFSSITDLSCCNSSSLSKKSLSIEDFCCSKASTCLLNFSSIPSLHARDSLRVSNWEESSLLSSWSLLFSSSLCKIDSFRFSLNSCKVLSSLSLERKPSLESHKSLFFDSKSCFSETIVLSRCSLDDSNNLICDFKSSTVFRYSCNFPCNSLLSFPFSWRLFSIISTWDFKHVISSDNVLLISLDAVNCIIVSSILTFNPLSTSSKFFNSCSFMFKLSL